MRGTVNGGVDVRDGGVLGLLTEVPLQTGHVGILCACFERASPFLAFTQSSISQQNVDTGFSRLQVAACVKTLHELYGEDFMYEVSRFVENDVAASASEDNAHKWAILLKNITEDDAKGIKDAFKAIMRLKQGVVSRIPHGPG